MLKQIAMYLPQFHRVVENDLWWGDGFTEWTAVRNAKKYYENHRQPRVPIDENYYDLMKKDTMLWQSELAKKYGIYGFCFYHYYFAEGKTILEKPAENLLSWKDVEMNYCFCWANETWTNTWSNINNSFAWITPYNETETRILLKQEYGAEREWKIHFEYLLPFFLDERYIKKDGKPVFMILKPDDISCIDEMMECWRRWAIEAGFDGIYFIVADGMKITAADGILHRGPGSYTDNSMFGKNNENRSINGIRIVRYKDAWENALLFKDVNEKDVYYQGFVDYDPTPRHGKHSWVFEGTSPEVFREFSYKLAIKNMSLGNEFYFINAWNEWGEGNYLEPDSYYGFSFLEASYFVDLMCNSDKVSPQKIWNQILIDMGQVKEDEDLKTDFVSQNKNRNSFLLLDKWLSLKEKEIRICDYFVSHKVKNISIYGMGIIGRHFLEEIRRCDNLNICSIYDRNIDKIVDMGYVVVDNEDNLMNCDMIVITIMGEEDSIKKRLENKVNCHIVSISDVINEMIIKQISCS